MPNRYGLIWRLWCEGLNTSEIAARLSSAETRVSEATVYSGLARILDRIYFDGLTISKPVPGRLQKP